MDAVIGLDNSPPCGWYCGRRYDRLQLAIMTAMLTVIENSNNTLKGIRKTGGAGCIGVCFARHNYR